MVTKVAQIAQLSVSLQITPQIGLGQGYLSASGTTIVVSAIDLTADVSNALPIANGGTGHTTASTAITALLPSQSGQSGNVL
jgi:hypothetical protein